MSDSVLLDNDQFTDTMEHEETFTQASQTILQVPNIDALTDGLPRLFEGNSDGSQPGQLTSGPILGKGGMAEVRLGRQLALNREVAVKSLHRSERKATSTEALIREARITGALEHPNIVPIHVLGLDTEGSPIIAMKRIEGTPWRNFIRNPRLPLPSWAPKDPLQFHLTVMMQVCNALRFAHDKGVVHRDLKPANVMVGEYGEIYLLDWGIAVDTKNPHAQRQQLIGTPVYMTPEMLSGDTKDVRPQTDLFQLGLILHRILTGKRRLTGKRVQDILGKVKNITPHVYEATIPQELAEICNRATARNIEDRFESAQAMQDSIALFLRHRGSIELTATAEQGLRSLRRMMDNPEEVKEDEAFEGRLHKLFGECRFAFKHALSDWPQNQRAQTGLQEVIEHMVCRELDKGHFTAAQQLLRELPAPKDELQLQLSLLGAQLAEEEAEFEKLQQYRKEYDLNVARNWRSLFAWATAIWSSAIPVAIGILQRQGKFTVTHNFNVAMAIGVIFTFGALITLMRKRLFQNLVNRRLVYCVCLTGYGLLVHRLSAMIMDLPIHVSMVWDPILFGFSASLLAVAVDRRVAWAAFVYLIFALISAANPLYAFELSGIANFVAVGLVALLWWQPRRRHPKKEQVSETPRERPQAA